MEAVRSAAFAVGVPGVRGVGEVEGVFADGAFHLPDVTTSEGDKLFFDPGDELDDGEALRADLTRR